jgi:hypothetical protein
MNNDLVNTIIQEAITIWEERFYKWLSLEEYQLCVEAQYETPMKLAEEIF